MKKEVSLVFRVTRQHADTLRLRLDGILNQRTTFDTEVVIVDRGSNDGTGDICQEYKALYPDKVRFYTRVPGDFPEKSRIIRLRGDLGIICRDEELWSDIFKLQRQGTFLMTHPEYDLCFHNVRGSNMQYMRSRGNYCREVIQVLFAFVSFIRTSLSTSFFIV